MVRGWRVALWVHAGVVAGFVVVLAVLLGLQPPGSGKGVNFGAGLFGGLPLFVLGLPWSPIGRYLFDTYGPHRAYARDPLLVAVSLVATLGGAPLNLALHAALYRYASRR